MLRSCFFGPNGHLYLFETGKAAVYQTISPKEGERIKISELKNKPVAILRDEYALRMCRTMLG